jgi:cytochrome c-type biogenesis protein CcmE
MGLQRRQVLIAAIIVSIALGYLMVSGMQDTMVFYYTVSEVASQRSDLEGEPLRVAGKVVAGTIEISSADHLDRSFVIHEGGERMTVVYRGVTPDTLVDDSDAVVEGRLETDGTFHATMVMAKCPSKYEGDTDYSKYRESGVGAGSETTP